jgi:hypothetical protein
MNAIRIHEFGGPELAGKPRNREQIVLTTTGSRAPQSSC